MNGHEYCPVVLNLRVPHKAHDNDVGEESPQLIDVKEALGPASNTGVRRDVVVCDVLLRMKVCLSDSMSSVISSEK